MITDAEYFIEHGPLLNDHGSIVARNGRKAPDFDVYPVPWVAAFAQAHPETGFLSDDEIVAKVDMAIKRLAVKSKMKGEKTQAQRERERSRQVQELGNAGNIG